MRVWRPLNRLLRVDFARSSRNVAIDVRLRIRFIAVAAVTIGAMLAVVAAVVVHDAQSDRAALEAHARLLARSSALMIDREMSGLDAMLNGLVSSPALKSGDLA